MVVKLDPKKTARSEDLAIKFVPRKKRAVSLPTASAPTVPLPDPLGADEPPKNAKTRSIEAVKLPSVVGLENLEVKTPVFKKWTEKNASEMTDRDWHAMITDLQLKSSVEIKPLLNWDELQAGKPLLQLLNQKFRTPTPIQRATVKLIMEKKCDCIGIAPTGSGKTLAFVLPFLLNANHKHGLVLAPTRELAMQTVQLTSKLRMTGVKCVALVGGHDIADQERELHQLQADSKLLLVATPGRLLDCVHRNLVSLKRVTYLVLDEADRMLDMGFEPQLSEINGFLSDKNSRQTLLFSATWPQSVKDFSTVFVRGDCVKLEVVAAPQQIKQEVVLLNGQTSRFTLLQQKLKSSKLSIVFVASKAGVDRLVEQLSGAGVRAGGLHGGMTQESRERALSSFKAGNTNVLVATDVAARGVDVAGVSLVVNYDMPGSIETYVHRIGRTGRGNMHGHAVSFVSPTDSKLFPELRKVLAQSRCAIPEFLRNS